MSMDSRIANKDKTILSLQLEELEPVFMGKKKEDAGQVAQPTCSFKRVGEHDQEDSDLENPHFAAFFPILNIFF